MSLAFLHDCKPIWHNHSKMCKRCHVTKPLDDFYEQQKCKDGKRHICKGCWNKEVRRG